MSANDNVQPIDNPRPRLFEFCTGDELDVDRYEALALRGSTAFFQLRNGYLKIEFDSVEIMRTELGRMRAFRDGKMPRFSVGDRIRTHAGTTGRIDDVVIDVDVPHYVVKLDLPSLAGDTMVWTMDGADKGALVLIGATGP